MSTQLALFGPSVVASPAVRGDAVFSPCGKYRYFLSRDWDSTKPRALFVMQNPSIAGATDPDKTISNLLGFCRRWGVGGFDVVNESSYIATDSKTYLAQRRKGEIDPHGPDHERWIAHALDRIRGKGMIVVAWGAQPAWLQEPFAALTTRLRAVGGLSCLGRTQDGWPRHPSRLGYSTRLEAFEPELSTAVIETLASGAHYHHCPKCYESWVCCQPCTIVPDLSHGRSLYGSHCECPNCLPGESP